MVNAAKENKARRWEGDSWRQGLGQCARDGSQEVTGRDGAGEGIQKCVMHWMACGIMSASFHQIGSLVGLCYLL